MIKHFCDECGEKLGCDNPNVIQPRLCESIGDWRLEFVISYQNVSNTGDLCPRCMCDLLNQITDRICDAKFATLRNKNLDKC